MPRVKDENPLAPWARLGEQPGVGPDDLEHVRALLNTDDRFHGVDRLPPDVPADVRQLRDALRRYLVDQDPAVVDELAAGHPLLVDLTADPPRLVAVAEGDLVAAVLADVLEAHRAGHWQRLKACANPDCRWIYYDASRNRSARWCSMGECGDVMKARAYRERTRAERPRRAPRPAQS